MSSIRFLLFEIKRVLVFNSTILKLKDLFTPFFFIQNAYADKNAKKNMFNESNCDRKSQLSGISTEPLNPCGRAQEFPRISGPSPPRRSGTVFFF